MLCAVRFGIVRATRSRKTHSNPSITISNFDSISPTSQVDRGITRPRTSAPIQDARVRGFASCGAHETSTTHSTPSHTTTGIHITPRDNQTTPLSTFYRKVGTATTAPASMRSPNICSEPEKGHSRRRQPPRRLRYSAHSSFGTQLTIGSGAPSSLGAPPSLAAPSSV